MTVDIAKAREALYRFCKGKEIMCVPARPDDDDALLVDALDELATYRDLSRDMYESLESLIRFVMEQTRGLSPIEKAKWSNVLPKAGAATERYMRQVLGENVGCVPRVEDQLKALRKVAHEAKELLAHPWGWDEGKLRRAIDELEATP